MAYRGYKYRLYPDSEARAHFARCFGATRYCYNYCVREYDRACSEGRQVSGFDIMAKAREHLNQLQWMADVDYEVKESAPMRFDKALSKFKRHQAERPREHKKGERPYESYTTSGVIRVDFKHDLVQLPKIGIIRARLHRTFTGEITSATVKREADGNYYISFTVSSDELEPAPLRQHTEQGTIGIDVGLRHLATLSNGETIDLSDTSRLVQRLQMLKHRHDLQHKGSRQYNATAKQIARLQRHLANITRDTQHKAAARLCRQYDTICMETLNVEGMRRPKDTAGNIIFNAELHRAALALFIERIQQKCADTGTRFVAVPRFEPTTKQCSACGYVLPTIDLDVKEWTCPECHAHHDRDHNAAINIRRKGLEQLGTITNPTLPPAEGNVRPAKKATAGCDLRTGKMTGRSGPRIKTQLDRQPKAQIAQGSAPPRIFKKEPQKPREPRFEVPVELKYFKLSPLAAMAEVSTAQLKKWMEQLTYGEMPEELKAAHDRILTAIRRVSDELKHTKIKYHEGKRSSYEVLGRMNKVARADWLIAEIMPVFPNFTVWRSQYRTPAEIGIINRLVTKDFTYRLDNMVERLKAFAYEPAEKKEQSPYVETSEKCILSKFYVGMHLKLWRFTKKAGITTHAFWLWRSYKYRYKERYFKYEDILRFLQTLSEFSHQLRGMEITDSRKRMANRQLKELEKELLMYNILWDAGFYSADMYDGIEERDEIKRKKAVYDAWRKKDKTVRELEMINQVVCFELPELIDKFVAEEMPALKWEIESVARENQL